MAKEIVEVSEVSDKEIDATTPGKGNIEFRERVPATVLTKIKAQTPGLVVSMFQDPVVAINFGQDVVSDLNNLSIKLLSDQENVEIPKADTIVNGVLRELDGYSAKYEHKEPGQVAQFFSKITGKAKETTYDLKAMVRDSKPIADRLMEAEGKIHKMELKLDENIVRGQQLREMTINAIDDVAKVIAVFEEALELMSTEILEAEKELSKAYSNDAKVIEYRDKVYSLDEYREVLADMVNSHSEVEKTWFNWRQKFFLYIVNIASNREIVNTSVSLKRTANRVRVDAIPAARTQLAAWQQAARMEETAIMVDKANQGVERLIIGASEGQLSAIKAATDANQRVMLSEETIMALTSNLQEQFKSIVEAEVVGRDVRAKNLELLKKSEEVIHGASAEAQKQLISQTVAQLSGNSANISIESANTQKTIESNSLNEMMKEETIREVPEVIEEPVKVEEKTNIKLSDFI